MPTILTAYYSIIKLVTLLLFQYLFSNFLACKLPYILSINNSVNIVIYGNS